MDKKGGYSVEQTAFPPLYIYEIYESLILNISLYDQWGLGMLQRFKIY